MYRVPRGSSHGGVQKSQLIYPTLRLSPGYRRQSGYFPDRCLWVFGDPGLLPYSLRHNTEISLVLFLWWGLLPSGQRNFPSRFRDIQDHTRCTCTASLPLPYPAELGDAGHTHGTAGPA